MRIQTTSDLMLQHGFAIKSSFVFKLNSLLENLFNMLALLIIEGRQVGTLRSRFRLHILSTSLFLYYLFFEALHCFLTTTQQPGDVLAFLTQRELNFI